MSDEPGNVPFNGDRALGQLAGGLLSLLCGVPIFASLLMIICGFLGVGVEFKSAEKRRHRKQQVCQSIKTRCCQSRPLLLHFISCIFGLTSCALDARKKLAVFHDEDFDFCDSLSKGFVLSYGVSKFCTYMFLATRAQIAWDSQAQVQQVATKWISLTLSVGFLILAGVATRYTSGSIEFNIRCIISIDKAWITLTFPALDFVLTFIYLLLFIIPLCKVNKYFHSRKDVMLNGDKRSWTLLIRETSKVALIQIAASDISLGMTAYGAVITGSFGLFTGSFVSFDLLANCVMQTYTTRHILQVSCCSGEEQDPPQIVPSPNQSKEKLLTTSFIQKNGILAPESKPPSVASTDKMRSSTELFLKE
eukprot:TRINITY_DN69898_c0_g1_i1.p1 TRINITY_DN69898_c0_g1~~TRINITY_DN69898_c0_g1_i1.p1  ORF type:complete len:363 (-),score=64.06 TRINITY_DN69898_c0_g1_i1:54-1142(-)